MIDLLSVQGQPAGYGRMLSLPADRFSSRIIPLRRHDGAKSSLFPRTLGWAIDSLFCRFAVEVLVVGLRIGAGMVDDAVPMVRGRIERIELQWSTAGIDDVVLRPGRNDHGEARADLRMNLSLIHISEPTRRTPTSYAVFSLKKKK